MKPGDSRGFLHKSAFGKFVGGAVGLATRAVGNLGIPGVSTAVRAARTVIGARGTTKDPRFLTARAVATSRGVVAISPSFGGGFRPPTGAPKMLSAENAARVAAGLPIKRKRMDVLNVKALRRANRRTSGFVKVAERALENTAFKIVRRTSTSRKKSSPTVIVESGPGSVVAR